MALAKVNSKVNVSGATNATPIVVTVSAPHGLDNGQAVVIKSVGGNTAANGTWEAQVLSTTSFSLVGSVGNADFTSGGTVSSVDPTAVANRQAIVKVYTTTTGTGALTLNGGPVIGYLDVDTFDDPTAVSYRIDEGDAGGTPTGNYETGTGVYTASGTSMTRAVVYSNSSGTTSPISLAAGKHTVTVVVTVGGDPLTTGAGGNKGTGSVVGDTAWTYPASLNTDPDANIETGAFRLQVTSTPTSTDSGRQGVSSVVYLVPLPTPGQQNPQATISLLHVYRLGGRVVAQWETRKVSNASAPYYQSCDLKATTVPFSYPSAGPGAYLPSEAGTKAGTPADIFAFIPATGTLGTSPPFRLMMMNWATATKRWTSVGGDRVGHSLVSNDAVIPNGLYLDLDDDWVARAIPLNAAPNVLLSQVTQNAQYLYLGTVGAPSTGLDGVAYCKDLNRCTVTYFNPIAYTDQADYAGADWDLPVPASGTTGPTGVYGSVFPNIDLGRGLMENWVCNFTITPEMNLNYPIISAEASAIGVCRMRAMLDAKAITLTDLEIPGFPAISNDGVATEFRQLRIGQSIPDNNRLDDPTTVNGIHYYGIYAECPAGGNENLRVCRFFRPRQHPSYAGVEAAGQRPIREPTANIVSGPARIIVTGTC